MTNKPRVSEVKWYSVDDKLPDIITRCRMMLVYSVCGVDIAFWDKKTKKFLDEPMGFEHTKVLFWAEMPNKPDQ